jgi:hypothetical protein
MKKNVLFVVLFVGLIFSVFGQSGDSNSNFHQIDLLKYVDKKSTNGGEDFQIGGFSKTGKVAYIIGNSPGDTGKYITNFIIFDFVNDKIVFKQTIDTGGFTYQGRRYSHYDDNNNETKRAYNSAYNLLLQNYIEKCRQNGIEFTAVEYRQLPIVNNNQNILINVEQRKFNNDYNSFNIRYNIITSKLDKKKQIASGEKNYAFDIFACGYFLSPFEDRALVVIGVQEQGFEGSIDYSYIFTGCHLLNGFN